LTPAPRSPVVASVILGAAVGVFGVLAVASGLSVAKTTALSLLVFTGGADRSLVLDARAAAVVTAALRAAT
jgi:predicted branched-subunit amino acid permease